MPTIEQENNDQLLDSTSDIQTSRVLEDTPPQPEDEKKIKRIASLDFGRGLAIFGMVFFHVFMRMYDYSYLENMTEGVPEGTSIGLLVFFGILAFFGTWHAFFLFMSSIVNTYVTIRRGYKGANMLNNMFKQVFTGALLIVIGWFDTSFSYNGYFGQNILGYTEWSNFSFLYVGLFQAETLHMIGLCLIINAVLMYLLTRNNGHEKYRRNMLVYFGICLFIIVVTTILSYAGPVKGYKSVIEYILDMFGASGQGGLTLPIIQNATAEFGAFPAWLLSFTIAGLQPLFPYLVTAFVGVMIGLTIAKPDVTKRHTAWGLLIGLGVTIIGVIFTIINFKYEYRWTIMQRTSSLSTYMVRLGIQMLISFGVVRAVEFRGRGAKFANRPFIKFLRFWSVISLTVYILQLFEFVPRAILTLIFNKNWIAVLTETPTQYGINFMKENIIPQGSEVMLVFVAAFTVLCFYWLQKLWSKIYYIGSFEWMILKLQQVIFKTKKVKIDADVLMNKVEWINFGQKVPIPT
ncbi:MAG: hypothetical protein FK733_17465 [Asgard group archaeon]|nr:hypothetical protein [Asgard group archaeon]